LEQEYFYNSLIIVKTCLRPKVLLRYILHVEKNLDGNAHLLMHHVL